MRLIDAEQIRDLIAPIAPMSVWNDVHYERIAFMDEIDRLPKIEAEPVVHAHWIRRFFLRKACKECYECSKCGRHSTPITNYCPNCGAKMDEENEMRVIDADEANERIALHKIDERQTLNIREEGTESELSKDVAPVIHAHWIPRYPRIGKAYSFKCSKCKKIVWCHTKVTVDDIDYNFCPYCGAKMDTSYKSD